MDKLELRMKNYEQLRVVQQLRDGIIEDNEFAEQKQSMHSHIST